MNVFRLCTKHSAVPNFQYIPAARLRTSSNFSDAVAFGTNQGKTNTQVLDPKPFSTIPKDDSHWILNVMKIFLTNGGFYKSFYKIQENIQKDFGSIVKRQSAIGEEIWLYDPEDVKTVFRVETKYPQRFKTAVMEDFYARTKNDPGVFFLNGEKWQKHKRLMSQKMLRPLEMNKYILRINDIATEMVERISTIRNHPGHAKELEVDELNMELFKWSFETVADFLFDRRFNSLKANPPERAVAFIKAIGRFLDNIVRASLVPIKLYDYYQTEAYKEFNSTLLLMYKFTNKLIDEKLDDVSKRIEGGEDISQSNELIPFLLSRKHLSENEVCSSIVDTLFAGIDTTSNTMQWLLYLLAKNPEVQSRIRNEILQVLPENTEPDAASLQRMPLVKAAVKETLRLYPVLIITGRILEQDVVLSGYHVPAKTSVMLMHHAMGRCEKNFKHPLDFIPERWLRNEGNGKFDAYASIPFGHGVRMCLGRRLAELELYILLVKIMKRYTLDLPQGHTVGNYFRGVNIPDKPIRVRFIDR